MTPMGRCENRIIAMISKNLRSAIHFCGPNMVFGATDVSARSLRTTGAMVLFCVSVNIINLIGRWCSYEMIFSLNVQAKSIMRNTSSLMLAHGIYYFFPNKRHSISNFFSCPPVLLDPNSSNVSPCA